ncbi:MAG: L,D-transpeptidase family protein [Chitinophagaceae bacterium]|nr:L,D-transpeptidase family protein [Chitinophagaceae bacterium]
MYQQKVTALGFTLLVVCFFILSCNDGGTKAAEKKIVANPDQIDDATSSSIEQLMSFALNHNGRVDDTTKLQLVALVNGFYKSNEFKNIWSKKEKWQPLADSLFRFIKDAELYGLFPKDYQAARLSNLKNQLDTDSLKRMDAVLWSKADMLLTDACLHIIKDLKYGRLSNDSTALASDTAKKAKALIALQQSLLSQPSFNQFLSSIEPKNRGYLELKKGIRHFLDSMDRRTYTYVIYPYKKNDAKDSLFFIKTLQKRLNESKCISFINKLPDSAQLDSSIRRYQKLKGVKQDGQVSASIIKALNTSDAERFKRIAITLDRYKKLPDSLPEKFIWVNLPGYYLQLWDTDTLALESRIICGKPATPTPQLNSVVTDMVTYPTWTVPTSIIAKQYLPKLKNNPNYLSRLGLKLMNEKGETISASSVNWGKYSKGIPYKVMQNSGDNNALGIFKFNFNNPYAVYLHDTNQRYLFKNSSRAYSHGCVRVQEWQKLANYLIRNDSINLKPGDSLQYSVDSVKTLLAEKKNRRIIVKNPVYLYITYFSCEGKDGKIRFYEDIYGDDKALREKYFTDK